MLALLLDTELSSTQRDYAQTAQGCGKALIALINEVLDRAKIEAGKLELEMVPFDIRSILDDVLSLFSEKSRHKGIEVSLALSVSYFDGCFPASQLLFPFLHGTDIMVLLYCSVRVCLIYWKVKLAVFVSNKVPEIINGDPGRFRQIITNLVDNSVKVSRLLSTSF